MTAAYPLQWPAAYRALAVMRHPDKPTGSQAMMAELNTARDAAFKALANV